MGKRGNGVTRQGYTVRLDPKLVTQLKHVAVDEKRTISDLMEEAIRLFLGKYLSEQPTAPRKTKQRMLNLTAGRIFFEPELQSLNVDCYVHTNVIGGMGKA